MDPDAALAALREALKAAEKATERGDDSTMALAYGAAHAHMEALDEWLSAGGFLPAAWQHERKGNNGN